MNGHALASRTLEETAAGLIAAAKVGWSVRDFALFMRPWLDADVAPFDFPTWRVRARPWDWAWD